MNPIQRALITDYLNTIVGEDFDLSHNGCNVQVAKIFDIILKTDYHEKIYGNFTDIKDGIKKAKKLCGFRTVKEALQKHCELTDEIQDLCIVLEEHKGYQCSSIIISGHGLTELDNKWFMRPVSEIQYSSIYKFKEL